MATAAVAPKLKYRIRPRHKWVLVRKLALEQIVTDAGVIVDRSQVQSYKAEVVEVSFESDLKVGDIVLVSAFGMEMPDLEEMTGDKALLMLRDEEVYCRAELLEHSCT